MDAELYDSPASYFAEVQRVWRALPFDDIRRLRAMLALLHRDSTIYVVGNGGFATVAEHFALGMTLNTMRESGTSFRAFNLASSGAVVSSAVNDYGYGNDFAAQIGALGRTGDLLLALSGSGASPNVVNVCGAAQRTGITVVSIVGADGHVAEDSDLCINLRCTSNAVCEDVAMMILHWVYGTFMVQGRPS